MGQPLREPTEETIEPGEVTVAVARPSRAPASLPPVERVDVGALARDLALELWAERLQVSVETAAGDPFVHGCASDIRRVLRWMIDRSSAVEGGAPWVALRVVPGDDAVSLEVAWSDEPPAGPESRLFEDAVAELGATFRVTGLRARLELPRDLSGVVPLVSGIRPRPFDEASDGADARTEPPPPP